MTPERRYVVAVLETVAEFFSDAGCPLTLEQASVLRDAQMSVVA